MEGVNLHLLTYCHNWHICSKLSSYSYIILKISLLFPLFSVNLFMHSFIHSINIYWFLTTKEEILPMEGIWSTCFGRGICKGKFLEEVTPKLSTSGMSKSLRTEDIRSLGFHSEKSMFKGPGELNFGELK